MIRVEGEIVIQQSVETVFDFVADERNEPRYNPRLLLAEQISPGPIGLGTRFRAEAASRGRPVEMVIEFTAYERPRRLSSSTRMSTMDMKRAGVETPPSVMWVRDGETRTYAGRRAA